jgi:hypothetical protein
MRWTMLITGGLVGAFLGADLEGQMGSPDARVALEVTTGRMSSPPDQFSTAICPDPRPSAVDLRVRLRLTPHLFAMGTATRYSDSPGLCVNGLVPPIPSEGPFVRNTRGYPPGTNEYPYRSYSLRLGGAVSPEELDTALGVSGGVSWIPSKELMGPVVGGYGAVGIPRVPASLIVSMDWKRYRIPVVFRTWEYFDGELVGASSRLESETTSFRVWRLGVEVTH